METKHRRSGHTSLHASMSSSGRANPWKQISARGAAAPSPAAPAASSPISHFLSRRAAPSPISRGAAAPFPISYLPSLISARSAISHLLSRRAAPATAYSIRHPSTTMDRRCACSLPGSRNSMPQILWIMREKRLSHRTALGNSRRTFVPRKSKILAFR